MKKALLAVVLISMAGLAWSRCKSGNISVIMNNPGSSTGETLEFCCKAVGDGTAWSCTENNQDWILVE